MLFVENRYIDCGNYFPLRARSGGGVQEGSFSVSVMASNRLLRRAQKALQAGHAAVLAAPCAACAAFWARCGGTEGDFILLRGQNANRSAAYRLAPRFGKTPAADCEGGADAAVAAKGGRTAQIYFSNIERRDGGGMKAEDLFLELVRCGTQSDEASQESPSTPGQRLLARLLAEKMESMGISGARVDRYGYVYGEIPATAGCDAPAIGLIAHMDTATELPGEPVRPRVVADYDGGDIVLNEERGIVMRVSQFPRLKEFTGERLIVTDGTTLLGADDKAGIAEILTAAGELLQSGRAHGPVKLAFTPDEEIGRGADHFDVAAFGAEFAYTVDGGPVGELEFENFNAAAARIAIQGENIHPGSAKNRMKNSMHIAMEFDALLPRYEVPAATEGYEGFFHLEKLHGEVERTELDYLIRDFSREGFERRKRQMLSAVSFLNRKYGEGTAAAAITDSYYNMKEQLLPHPQIIELAKEAMRRTGVEPRVIPIRGGTDGARLSFMGLPCPNLCTGGENGHGRYEFIAACELDRVARILVELIGCAGEWAQERKW